VPEIMKVLHAEPEIGSISAKLSEP
jgi:hypothetical protein